MLVDMHTGGLEKFTTAPPSRLVDREGRSGLLPCALLNVCVRPIVTPASVLYYVTNGRAQTDQPRERGFLAMACTFEVNGSLSTDYTVNYYR